MQKKIYPTPTHWLTSFIFQASFLSAASNMASSSNSNTEKGSPSNSSGSENGFLDILAAQESFFNQIDSIMSALGSKEANEDGLVSLEPKYIKTLQDVVGNMKVRDCNQKKVFFCRFLF